MRTINRCGIAAAVMTVALAVVPLVVAPIGGPAFAAEAQDQLKAEATRALDAWIAAVASGDPQTLGRILAPDFQIVRADGSVHDRDGYLASDLPRIETIPPVENLAVTTEGDIMVTSYVLNLKQTRDGKVVQADCPTADGLPQVRGRLARGRARKFRQPGTVGTRFAAYFALAFHGVSGTGVSGLPLSNQLVRLSTQSCPMPSRV